MTAKKSKPELPKVSRGDLVLVTWLDIVSSGNGDPARADLHTWETPGYYYGTGQRSGVDVLVLALSGTPNDKSLDDQAGYICIPLACVQKVQRSGRGRIIQIPEAD